MCGICGIVHSNKNNTIDMGLLKSMNDLITHRGPDETGYFHEKNIGLAMSRLKIIDLDTGSQPISNEDNTIITVFNGEIYNFQSLRKELESYGHKFQTFSDTEVIVHAYEEWGLDFPLRFNGMFAIALYDKNTEGLILVRDRFGIKPLYYLDNPLHFVFGSELKTIIRSNYSKLIINELALSFFLSLEYIPCPHTLIRDIKKLDPGHMLIVRNGNIKKIQYYDILANIHSIKEDNIKEQIFTQLSDSVKRRLISDVPLGAFLSGGIDSSIIVYLMKANHADPLRTFSIGFDESSYNELKYSNIISRMVDSDHIAFKLKPEIISSIDEIIYNLDEPIGDFSIFPTYMISRLTREHVTVALSGDGGDELFGGYEQYKAQIIARYFQWIPGFIMHQLYRIEDRIKPGGKKKGIINNLKRLIYGMRFDKSLMHYRWMLFFDNDQLKELFLDKSSWEHFNTITEYIKGLFQRAEGLDHINQMCFVDFSLYMQENILLKVDRMSMANSLEVRVPFLDHNVAELAFSIKGKDKIRGFNTKYILKQTFKNRLPDDIIKRKKEGFSIPLKNWIKGELREMISSVLLSKDAESFFNREYTGHLLSQHMHSTHNHSHRLWAMFIFLKWHEKFIKNSLN